MAPRPAAEVEQALARLQRQRPLDEAGLVFGALGAQLVAVDVEIAVAEKALVPGRVAHRHASLADGPCVYTGYALTRSSPSPVRGSCRSVRPRRRRRGEAPTSPGPGRSASHGWRTASLVSSGSQRARQDLS